jgi:hypothetical protein
MKCIPGSSDGHHGGDNFEGITNAVQPKMDDEFSGLARVGQHVPSILIMNILFLFL